MTLQTQRVQTLEQVRRVAEGNEPVDFAVADRASAYDFIGRTFVQFDYSALDKADKGAVKAYLAKLTGLSRAQLTRLMAQHRETGRIRDRRGGGPARPFVRRYTAADVRLLAEVDTALAQRCAPATRAVLRRQYEVFGDERFVRLARLSNGHLYNLRKSRTYRCRRTVFTKTRARAVAIGERRKPRPDGQPGFVRVDTVHQGDLDGVKGVYYVNIVDEVTQYEHIGCVPAISERFLVPVLEALIRRLDVAGRVLTLDALHSCPKTAQLIVAKGADYVLPVKGNHRSLLDDLKAFDADFDCAPLARTLDKAHGRLEERTCALVVLDGQSDDLAPLPGRRQALRIVRHRTVLRTQRTTTEVTYGLTSLGPDRAGPAEVLALNRGHWEIENRLHYVRDFSCDEDRSRIRTGALPRNLACLANAALSIVRLRGRFQYLPQAQRHYAARQGEALREVIRPA